MRARVQSKKIIGLVLATVLSATTACARATAQPSAAKAANPQDWQDQMQALHFPSTGCFTATYPTLQWQPVTCVAAPQVPLLPARQAPPQRRAGQAAPWRSVGGGGTNDFSARVADSAQPITAATGSFPEVIGVTSETGLIRDTGPSVADEYTLQLNSRPWIGPLCIGHSLCRTWQQFVFNNNNAAGSVYIEYWLLQYNAPCPDASWITYILPGTTDVNCYRDSPATPLAGQPITNLTSLSLTGSVSDGGTDAVILSTGVGAPLMATNTDSVLWLAPAWQDVEFMIGGPGSLREATFNSGSTILVKTMVHNGTTAAPNCIAESFTGETNNLTRVGTAEMGTGDSPYIATRQSNIPGTPASCAAGDGTGDTHLRTFSGLLYDFQATGDFLLAQTDDFTVHTRQISGAPTWPNAAVNQAVAAKLGTSRVAFCTAPSRLAIDGKATEVPEGRPYPFGDGGSVTRTGNVFMVTDKHGNSLRVVDNGGWLDASVGLGSWPVQVRGLLANPDGDVTKLATADGTALKVPLSFDDLYGTFGNSWRVSAADSLLSDCGSATERANPAKPFFADALDPKVRQRAQGLCAQVGIKDPGLLNACELDVAVLGDKAAQAYVGATPPVLIGN